MIPEQDASDLETRSRGRQDGNKCSHLDNGTKTSHRSDPEDTLNESSKSALAELRVSAALDTEFLYCCMLCGESYGCQEDLKRHKELLHQQPNCDNETADDTGMNSLTLPRF